MEIFSDSNNDKEYIIADMHGSKAYIIGKSINFILTEPFNGCGFGAYSADYRIYNVMNGNLIGEFPKIFYAKMLFNYLNRRD